MPMEAGHNRSVPKYAERKGARENHPHESTHESQLFGKNEGMSLVTPPLMAETGDGSDRHLFLNHSNFKGQKFRPSPAVCCSLPK